MPAEQIDLEASDHIELDRNIARAEIRLEVSGSDGYHAAHLVSAPPTTSMYRTPRALHMPLKN